MGAGGTPEPLGRFLGLSLTDEGTEPPPVEPEPVPVAHADSFTTEEDTPATFNVLTNDVMDDGTPIPAGAKVQVVVSPSLGTAAVNADGTIRYVPKPDANGADSLQYRVTVNGEPSQAAMVTITVTPVDEPPPPAETIAISQATYQVKRDRWTVSGTSTVTSGNHVLEIRYLAPGADDGPVFGRVTVSTAGAWLFDSRGSGVKAATGSRVKVVSPTTGAVQVANVTIS